MKNTSLQKNSAVQLSIESLASDGAGVAHAGGMAVFVPFAAPTSAGAIAIVASLIVAPLVSLFTPKLSQAHLDVTFSCYDERIAAPHKLILEQVSE